MLRSVVLFSILFVSCYGAQDRIRANKSHLPSYIKPCRKSDPNFDDCCLEHAKEAFPYIIKGDRKFQVPVLDPLSVPEVSVDAGNDLHIKLMDAKLFGLNGAEIKMIKIDYKNMRFTGKVFIPRLEVKGKYEIDGKIMILPITGRGDLNITALNGEYTYTFEYGVKQVNGVDYLDIKDNDKLDFKVEKATFNLENLFNGDPTLGPQTNKFLNENWQDVIKELGGPITETVTSVGRLISTGYFGKIPYHELLLE